MKIYRQDDLDAYSKDDWLMQRMESEASGPDAGYTTHQWLVDSAPKRMIFADVYGDLLESEGRSVLDIGGGYSSLSRALAKRHDYHVVDIMAHDDHGEFATLAKDQGDLWTNSDWLSFVLNRPWDVIIANDLFPNVDQRVAQFVELYRPSTDELRLTLTFYNAHRSYTVKRVDGDEVFNMLAWDGAQVTRSLAPFVEDATQLQALEHETASIFPNGRQVCSVRIPGTRSD